VLLDSNAVILTSLPLSLCSWNSNLEYAPKGRQNRHNQYGHSSSIINVKRARLTSENANVLLFFKENKESVN